MIRQIERLVSDFARHKNYILFSTLLFIVSIYIGYQWTVFHSFLDGQIEGLAETAGSLMSMENSSFWFFMFIFLNNAIKCIMIVFLGVFLGVLPIVFLLINGMVLGYLYLILQEHGGTLSELLVGILPHGIIELPVLFIASAYGIRLGFIVLKSPLKLLSTHREKRPELVPFLQKTPALMVFITISLFVAALIEAYITPVLMGL